MGLHKSQAISLIQSIIQPLRLSCGTKISPAVRPGTVPRKSLPFPSHRHPTVPCLPPFLSPCDAHRPADAATPRLGPCARYIHAPAVTSGCTVFVGLATTRRFSRRRQTFSSFSPGEEERWRAQPQPSLLLLPARTHAQLQASIFRGRS